VQTEDLAAALLNTRHSAAAAPQRDDNLLLQVIGPIMAGMLIFYAFFTGTSTAQSILKDEEEAHAAAPVHHADPAGGDLSGKFLSVFLTVLVQVSVLLAAAHLIFRIQWGELAPLILAAAGIVFCAASFGICINSFLKTPGRAAQCSARSLR